jgi:hypothetical protein
MPFVIDDIIGLVGIAIAVPGLVQTFIHASRWLSKRLDEISPSPEKTKIQDFLIFLDRGTMRTTLETVEDLCVDTSDVGLRNDLQASAKKLWAYMVELDQQVRKIKSVVGSEKQTKHAREKALAVIENMRNLEFRLRQQVQAHLAANTLRSRFELRDAQFCLIGNSTRLQFSTASVGRGEFSLQHRQGEGKCLLEYKSFPGLSYKDAYIKAVDLARNVQFFNASNGLPELIGFQGTEATPLQDQRFTFVFSFPKDRTKPRSLRDVFLDPVNTPTPPIPRNFRFILPRKLAESIYHVHEQQLVHKCLRPESILLFEPSPGDSPELKYPKTLGSPILADWQYARTTAQVSKREAYDDWTLAMYQHPERQALPGEVAESKYNIGHDIYSLGVCLLEIGLWDSFIIYDNNVPKPSHLLSKVKAKWKEENSHISQDLTESQIEQKIYIALAGDRLAYEMGEAYSKLVIKCLTCIEQGFGNVLMFVDSESRDWYGQGVLFIQEIRKRLVDASTMGSGIYNTIS